MKPTVTILIGAPLSGVEARFLRQLYTDLKGTEALILARFETPKRQIDFVVTPTYSALLELKNFPLPIFGEQNGTWTYETSGGARIRYQGENPWQQAKEAKYALSDEMVKFQRTNRSVPPPAGRGYFMQFAGFVCVYPRIHRDSRVTAGDHKIAVASYPDILDSIRCDSISSTWSLSDWRHFAEDHLNLSRASLAEATDAAIHAASEHIRSYRTRLSGFLGTDLAPLLPHANGANYGEALIESLLEPKNFLLLGPTGSAKTFHLQHLAIATAGGEQELPFLLEAKRFKGGDFWSLLRQGAAAFFPGDPRTLLDAAKVCGLRPLLIVDALNECSDTLISDLLRGMQSFAIQYEARIVLSSQLDFIHLRQIQ